MSDSPPVSPHSSTHLPQTRWSDKFKPLTKSLNNHIHEIAALSLLSTGSWLMGNTLKKSIGFSCIIGCTIYLAHTMPSDLLDKIIRIANSLLFPLLGLGFGNIMKDDYDSDEDSHINSKSPEILVGKKTRDFIDGFTKHRI